uniref:Uncharacterized protein n=1 Tax=viral metagenome TaxID=1070528 RepID=A0A6C0LFN4_9ZZZZ
MKRRKTYSPVLEAIAEDGNTKLLTAFDRAIIAEFAGLGGFRFIQRE